MAPTILITRPGRVGAEFAERLEAQLDGDVTVVLSPLMRIEHCGALPQMAGYRTLIFTSRHGVEAYVAKGGRCDLPAFGVGEATAQAAREAGMNVTACGGDARDLIAQLLSAGVTAPCLHLRGTHAASDIATLLSSAGLETDEAVIYRQLPEPLTQVARTILAGAEPVLVPLFSPRSARLFFGQACGAAPLLVAAISRNAAAAVPDDRVAAIEIAHAPSADAMLDAIKKLLDKTKRLEGGNTAK
ncbi:MAG: uroporphyrinogen-III synthase [Pseudomonadota bacterium]|uniref:uroporphyrinogen-III synthase n=1 Tax=Roseovarius TaxID=74030 RepID=UPI0022A7C6DC|nr:uroporphyrinogen-III synthase [Roseovarius sp. EGI FJ00037]MCZ0811212.1 uroporphyrinogen-III synthase [Roseovarius sp. EGI FJ00037]